MNLRVHRGDLGSSVATGNPPGTIDGTTVERRAILRELALRRRKMDRETSPGSWSK